ncbi:MAG: thrombospondin type 3 repeat-containing protein [Actinobacteria bacterium]|nr:thrombospondin type 3 repeat-containing protein [Actinomycetota bacterium]
MKNGGKLGALGGTLLASGLLLALVFAGVIKGANGAEYADTADDAGQAADVIKVVVSNDDAGVIAIQLQFKNRPPFGSEGINVYIDSDQNGTTGTNGVEYRARYYGDSAPQIALERWSGSAWVSASAPTFSGSTSANGLSFNVNRADLGTTGGLNFWVYTATNAPGTDYVPDSAPAGGRLSYTVIVAGPPATTTPPPPPPPPTTPPPTTPPPVETSPQPLPPTPTVAEIVALPDTDGDGVPNSSDACPSTAAGKYDANKNGCPGPFSAINARIAFQLRVPPLQFRELRIKGVPFQGTVELRTQGFRERLKGSGSVASRKLLGRALREGAILELRVFKVGWIGYYARLRVSSSGVTVVSRQCLPPTGGEAPQRCGAALRGR